jgi:hypothetical protein
LPELSSVREIDRDIVACEVALTALNGGGHVFDSEREGLARTLAELLELRLQCERHLGTVLHFPMREKAGPSGSPQPTRGLA